MQHNMLMEIDNENPIHFDCLIVNVILYVLFSFLFWLSPFVYNYNNMDKGISVIISN